MLIGVDSAVVRQEFQTVAVNVDVSDSSVCETNFCGIIDQSLFHIDLTVYYIQNFENLT